MLLAYVSVSIHLPPSTSNYSYSIAIIRVMDDLKKKLSTMLSSISTESDTNETETAKANKKSATSVGGTRTRERLIAAEAELARKTNVTSSATRNRLAIVEAKLLEKVLCSRCGKIIFLKNLAYFIILLLKTRFWLGAFLKPCVVREWV